MMKLSLLSGVRGIFTVAASSVISRLWAGPPSGCRPAHHSAANLGSES